MKKITAIFFCIVACSAASCPPINLNDETTWKISFARGDGIYFEKLGFDGGFYVYENDTIAGGRPFIHFFQGASLITQPSPAEIGFPTEAPYTVNENVLSLITTVPGAQLNLYISGSSNIASYNITFDKNSVCAGFQIGTYLYVPVIICPYFGNITQLVKCRSYDDCYPCGCACASCDGYGPYACTSCVSGYFLQQLSKQCLTYCDAGYPDPSTNTCISTCDSTCYNCSGPSNQSCMSCNGTKGYYLQPSSQVCLKSCPDGYRGDISDVLGTCIPCSPDCSTCELQTGQCVSCSTGYYWVPKNKACLNTCPDNYYHYSANFTCLECDSICDGCYDAGNTSCKNCREGYYAQPGGSSTSPKACLKTCPDGYYPYDRVCEACSFDCKTCFGSGSWSCYSCSTGYYLQPTSTVCAQTCPPYYYYPDPKTNTCTPCDISCATCSDSANTSCTTCRLGYYQQPSLPMLCLKTCPDGYWSDSSLTNCYKCDSKCASCHGFLNTACDSCNSGYFLQPSPKNTTCGTTCPDGYYGNSFTNTCTPCDISCVSCTAAGNGRCIRCSKGYFQFSSSNCLASCPSGYWNDLQTAKCQPCDPSCSNCYGPSSNQCTACNTNYFLGTSTSTCLSACKDLGVWADSTNRVCAPCNPACSNCAGGSYTNCIACNKGYYLQPYSRTCLENCPSSYYPDDEKGACNACYAYCTTCTGPNKNNCASCADGFYFNPTNQTCSTSCPDGYWKDKSSNNCASCDAACLKCLSAGSEQCVDCVEGYYLQPQSVGCNASCPSGYYPNSSARACYSCSKECQNCTGSGNINVCTSCTSGYYLQPLSDSCLSTCPQGYDRDKSTNTCTTAPVYRSWSFICIVISLVWGIGSLILVNSISKEICVVNSCKPNFTSNKMSVLKIAVVWLVTHPLLSVYFYKDPNVPKKERCILYYVRVIMILLFSALMHTKSANASTTRRVLDSSDEDFKTSYLLLFIILFCFVLPLSSLLDRALRWSLRNKLISKRLKSEGKTAKITRKKNLMSFLGIYIIYGAALVLSIIAIAICFSRTPAQQVVWKSGFLGLFFIDLLLSSIVCLVFNLILIKLIIENRRPWTKMKRLAKTFSGESTTAILLTVQSRAEIPASESKFTGVELRESVQTHPVYTPRLSPTEENLFGRSPRAFGHPIDSSPESDIKFIGRGSHRHRGSNFTEFGLTVRSEISTHRVEEEEEKKIEKGSVMINAPSDQDFQQFKTILDEEQNRPMRKHRPRLVTANLQFNEKSIEIPAGQNNFDISDRDIILDMFEMNNQNDNQEKIDEPKDLELKQETSQLKIQPDQSAEKDISMKAEQPQDQPKNERKVEIALGQMHSTRKKKFKAVSKKKRKKSQPHASDGQTETKTE